MQRAGPPSASAVQPGFISVVTALDGHRNSLGFIRLGLALLVIVSHSFPLGGYGLELGLRISHGQATLGTIAVYGFFALSGYLIVRSGLTTDVIQFLWSRALRILPAFWVALLVMALVVAPVVAVSQGSALSSFFSSTAGGPWSYLRANWTLDIGAYGVRDVFLTTTPYGLLTGTSVLNGSIWSLIYEWQCYLLVAGAVAFGVLKQARVTLPVMTIVMLVLQVISETNPGTLSAAAPYLADPLRISLTLTFFVGATIALYGDDVPYSHRLGLGAGFVALLTYRYGGFLTVGIVAGTYFALYLAAALPSALHRVGARNDYSYGVYVYGFLVQQVLAHLQWNRHGYVPYTIASIAITVVLAWVSWHVVEKPALRLKRRGPGRGIEYWSTQARDLTSRPTSRPRTGAATGRRRRARKVDRTGQVPLGAAIAGQETRSSR